jgi:hypothetical protein
MNGVDPNKNIYWAGNESINKKLICKIQYVLVTWLINYINRRICMLSHNKHTSTSSHIHSPITHASIQRQ